MEGLKVGDIVRMEPSDLSLGPWEGTVRRLEDEDHVCVAVEITKRAGEPFNFDGHDCGGVCNSSGWFVHRSEILEVVG